MSPFLLRCPNFSVRSNPLIGVKQESSSSSGVITDFSKLCAVYHTDRRRGYAESMTSSGGMEYRSQGCEYKGPWSAVEDRIVCEMVTTHGVGKIKWSEIAAHLPGRLGKQIRERWLHHLDPNINKAKWTASEDATLIDAHRTLGNQWAEIAKRIPGRAGYTVRHRWHSAELNSKLSALSRASVSGPGVMLPGSADPSLIGSISEEQGAMPAGGSDSGASAAASASRASLSEEQSDDELEEFEDGMLITAARQPASVR